MSGFETYAGKRVVVSGASSGIGKATAQALADLGAEVIGVGSRPPAVEGARHVRLDLSDPESITAAASQIGGRVDVLFNCAGATPMLASTDILKVNFLGTRLFTESIIPYIPSGGAIVNVSSDGGYGWRTKRELILDLLAIPDFDGGSAWYAANEERAGHAYSFGKEALDVWTMQQSQLLIAKGIRINTVSPGAVQTPMLDAIEDAYTSASIDPVLVPSGRRSSPEEQAGPILFLGSEAASYVNGADIAVDGGYWASLNLAGSIW
ncbi:coniferyl-alcohol dehydrogenase [Cryobacterium sp. AP23]